MYEFIAACSCPKALRHSRIPGIQTCKTDGEIRAIANFNQRHAVMTAAEEEMPLLQANGVKVEEIKKQIRNGRFTTYDPATMRHHILACTMEQIEKPRPTPPQGEQISLETG
jgi:hypothetical protein